MKQNSIVTSHGDLKSKYFFPNFQSSNDQLLILNFSKDYLINIIGNFEDKYMKTNPMHTYHLTITKKWSELIIRGITSIMKLIIGGSNNQRKKEKKDIQ